MFVYTITATITTAMTLDTKLAQANIASLANQLHVVEVRKANAFESPKATTNCEGADANRIAKSLKEPTKKTTKKEPTKKKGWR